jgi:hypothetical protein
MNANILRMTPENAEEFRQQYRRIVWAEMMAGKVVGWKAFFEMIEDGTSRRLLAENVRYPI